MRILVFALRGMAAELVGTQARALHPQDDVFLIHVRNATQGQLEKAIGDCRPNRLYFAEPTAESGVALRELSPGKLPSSPARDPLPAALVGELAAEVKRLLPALDPADPDGQPPRPVMRRMLDQLIPQSADFDLFLERHFPKVWRRLSSGMNRVARTNELLATTETHLILPQLADRADYDRLRLAASYDLYYSEHWTPSSAAARS